MFLLFIKTIKKKSISFLLKKNVNQFPFWYNLHFCVLSIKRTWKDYGSFLRNSVFRKGYQHSKFNVLYKSVNYLSKYRKKTSILKREKVKDISLSNLPPIMAICLMIIPRHSAKGNFFFSKRLVASGISGLKLCLKHQW